MKLIDILLDAENKDPIELNDQNGRVISFEQLAVIPITDSSNKKTIYCILKPIDTAKNGIKEKEYVFRAFPNDDGSDVLLAVEQSFLTKRKVLRKYKRLKKQR